MKGAFDAPTPPHQLICLWHLMKEEPQAGHVPSHSAGKRLQGTRMGETGTAMQARGREFCWLSTAPRLEEHKQVQGNFGSR